MISDEVLFAFLYGSNREKRLAVLDSVVESFSEAGRRAPLGELLELIPWYADNHETGEAARLVFEAASGD